MVSNSYRFKLGDFECIALNDGNFNYSLESFFANAPKEQLEESLRQHNLPTTHVASVRTCLFVDMGQHQLPGSGRLAVVQTGKGREYGIGYHLGCFFGAGEEPVGFSAVKQAGQVEPG